MSASVAAAESVLPAFIWDDALIRRYDLSGPRYTSYPTAVEFSPAFGAQDMIRAAERSRAGGGPVSLYTHLPFCAHLCYYCACNKVITKKRDKAMPYVERVLKEAAMQSQLFGADRPVQQLHWGGGTPTFLPKDVMEHLMAGYGEFLTCSPVMIGTTAWRSTRGKWTKTLCPPCGSWVSTVSAWVCRT